MQDLPKVQLTLDQAGAGVPLVDLYVQLGFASSKSDARKLMQVIRLFPRHRRQSALVSIEFGLASVAETSLNYVEVARDCKHGSHAPSRFAFEFVVGFRCRDVGLRMRTDVGLRMRTDGGLRISQGGGARVNDVQVQDINYKVTAEAIKEQGGALKISMGKKKHAMVEIEA